MSRLHGDRLNGLVSAPSLHTVINPMRGAWITYTPTWSGTIGNGTLNGAWQRIGRTVNVRINITWGTTTTHPVASQQFSVPFAAHATLVAAVAGLQSPVGSANGTSAGAGVGPTAFYAATMLGPFAPTWTNIGWASTNFGSLFAVYEAAADV